MADTFSLDWWLALRSFLAKGDVHRLLPTCPALRWGKLALYQEVETWKILYYMQSPCHSLWMKRHAPKSLPLLTVDNWHLVCDFSRSIKVYNLKVYQCERESGLIWLQWLLEVKGSLEGVRKGLLKVLKDQVQKPFKPVPFMLTLIDVLEIQGA